MSKERVLIISSSVDLHADFLQKKMNTIGIDTLRLNSDELENKITVTFRLSDGHRISGLDNNNKNFSFKTEDIYSVWMRKPFPTKFDLMNKRADVAFECREANAYLFDFCCCLDDLNCLWINNPEANRRADNKLRQLRLASSLGMVVPRTIVSNNPDEVNNFFTKQECSELIYKTMSYPFIEASNGYYRCVYTTRIELTDEIKGAIRKVPCLIQEEIKKKFELRLVVVGDKVFGIKIFSQDHYLTQVDWRKGQGVVSLKQQAVQLEKSLIDFCVKMVNGFGLRFGTIDIIVTPDDEFVFLELNPNGQWAWMEVDFGINISDSLIRELSPF